STLAEERQAFLNDLAAMNAVEKNKRRLVIQWIGANDLITVNETPSMEAADKAVIASLENIKVLIANGCKDFRIGNLPDLSLTPRFHLSPADEKLNVRLVEEYFNRQLKMGMEELQKLYPDCNIKVIDVNTKFKGFINGLQAGGEKAKDFKKYIDLEYKIISTEDLPSVAEKNKFYVKYNAKLSYLDYVVLDPCGQIQKSFISISDLENDADL